MAEIRPNVLERCVIASGCSCQNLVLGGSVWAEGQKLGGWYTQKWDLQRLGTWPRHLRTWESMCSRGWAAAECAPGPGYLGGARREGLEVPGRFLCLFGSGWRRCARESGSSPRFPAAVPHSPEGARGNQKARSVPPTLSLSHLRARDAAACRWL